MELLPRIVFQETRDDFEQNQCRASRFLARTRTISPVRQFVAAYSWRFGGGTPGARTLRWCPRNIQQRFKVGNKFNSTSSFSWISAPRGGCFSSLEIVPLFEHSRVGLPPETAPSMTNGLSTEVSKAIRGGMAFNKSGIFKYLRAMWETSPQTVVKQNTFNSPASNYK